MPGHQQPSRVMARGQQCRKAEWDQAEVSCLLAPLQMLTAASPGPHLHALFGVVPGC